MVGAARNFPKVEIDVTAHLQISRPTASCRDAWNAAHNVTTLGGFESLGAHLNLNSKQAARCRAHPRPSRTALSVSMEGPDEWPDIVERHERLPIDQDCAAVVLREVSPVVNSM
jgi:hypothetical protein